MAFYDVFLKRKLNLVDEKEDILYFPNRSGLLILPISMAKIENEQSPEKIMGYLEFLKYKRDKNYPIGVAIIYTSSVYAKYGIGDKKKYLGQVEKHEKSMKNIISNNSEYFLEAFNFIEWNELYGNNKEIGIYLKEAFNKYESDEIYREKIKYDIENVLNFTFNDNNSYFSIEEVVVIYLILKGIIKIENSFIKNRNKWILLCYPGLPLSHLAYLHQMRLVKSKATNEYQDCFYNLKKKKLYDLMSFNLDENKRID